MIDERTKTFSSEKRPRLFRGAEEDTRGLWIKTSRAQICRSVCQSGRRGRAALLAGSVSVEMPSNTRGKGKRSSRRRNGRSG
ncbi:Hypothetical protein SMAX5B_021542 [Scophthalmus maximus]|uniref:Uncharacterized protein n=1 Tax=Scophthalmus maximus TaxID=52904 RepID=A0A2U9B729_SCOMX|nr:Hypothetical protein SMAX5B_021542 [Scophthalmus maximus]